MEILIGIAFWGGLALAVVLFFVVGNWFYNRPHRVQQREDAVRRADLRRQREKYEREATENRSRAGNYTKSGQWIPHREYVSWEVIYQRDGNKCHICGKAVNKQDFTRTAKGGFVAGPKYPTVDHVVPQSKGGSHALTNLKLAHKACNSRKSATLDYDE